VSGSELVDARPDIPIVEVGNRGSGATRHVIIIGSGPAGPTSGDLRGLGRRIVGQEIEGDVRVQTGEYRLGAGPVAIQERR
jgi:hypothetical protein